MQSVLLRGTMGTGTVSTNIVWHPEGYYVEFILNGRVVDVAGPFDEESDAEDVASR